MALPLHHRGCYFTAVDLRPAAFIHQRPQPSGSCRRDGTPPIAVPAHVGLIGVDEVGHGVGSGCLCQPRCRVVTNGARKRGLGREVIREHACSKRADHDWGGVHHQRVPFCCLRSRSGKANGLTAHRRRTCSHTHALADKDLAPQAPRLMPRASGRPNTTGAAGDPGR